ncbi:MAG TPA: hypothetical protein VMU19_12955 [Bryobacteraceae bacterium]|nr:hypothetical protein [Bryobacteraceae bacterium]
MERWLYAVIYQCPECKRKTKIARFPAIYVASLHRTCPKCGGPQLEKLRKRDHIDPLYLNPISLLQGLIGAPIWWCPFCRLQFYDFRPGWPVKRNATKVAAK